MWGAGEVTVKLRAMGGPRTIRFREFSWIECPRQHPWGPSVSVNTVVQAVKGDETETRIEMQSGDVLTVVARAVEVT